ncbi:BatD family protein [bacterium]|nr:BatD family protein [bacterium]
MTLSRAYILCLCVLAALFTGAETFAQVTNATAVTVKATLDRDSIGLDEQAILQIVVAGTDQDLPAPQLPTLPRFEVYSQGRSSNIQIINNQMNVSMTYRYMLLPKQPGVFPITNISVVYKNKRYTAEPLELTVLDKGTAASPQLEDKSVDPTGKSRDYFLDAEIDNDNPYVNEQVTLTLKFYIAVQYYNTPELTQPPTTGFWTEILGNRAPYFQKLNGRNYQVLEVKYALFPTQTGELSIGRALIRTTVAAPSRTKRRSVFDDFFNRGQEITVRSKPLTVNVRPLPTKDRPDDFSGTIGRFQISATPDKTEVEVNQPVTVSVAITGIGNVKSVAEPEIGDLADFRVYRASSNENVTKVDDQIGGTKTFEEVFIPRRPGELTIPSLKFTFFNPRTSRYETKRTHPIKLNVVGSETYVAGSDVPYSTPGVSIGSQARDIRFIKQELGGLQHRGSLILLSPVYMAVNGIPVLVLIGLVVVRLRRERLSKDIGYARSRSASKVARKRLATAGSMASADKTEEFYAELSRAVTSYIADKLNMSPHGLTSDKIATLLAQRGADDDLVAETKELLRRCDFARFAPATISIDDIRSSLERGERLIVRMESVRFA